MNTMHGLVLDAEGHPNLQNGLSIPTPGKGEVVVRVAHSTVNGHEFELAQNGLLRLLGWLRGAPVAIRTGLEFAGVVESEGQHFSVGQRVMGYVDMVAGHKSHADYVAIPEAFLAKVPDGMSLEHAAALPMGAQTALVALREVASVEAGDRVLVFGASGGVGVMAVQIASVLGAEVAAVAGGAHHELLVELGASEVVDYRATKIEQMSGIYDAILDFSDTLRLRQVRHLLAADGAFVPADPFKNLVDIVFSGTTKWLMVDRGDASLLEEIAQWAAAGQLRAVVDRSYGRDQWRAAVQRSHERGRAGRVVLGF